MSYVMTIAAIKTAFPDEWVAAEVTAVDTADVPVAGVVLVHSPDKTVVYQAVREYRRHHPVSRLFLFFTGDPIPAGIGVAFAIR